MKNNLSGFAVALLLAASASAAPKSVTLSVPGMDCPVCPITIKAALRKVPGVQSAGVDYPAKRAAVVFDDTKAGVADLQQATANVGYPSTLVK